MRFTLRRQRALFFSFNLHISDEAAGDTVPSIVVERDVFAIPVCKNVVSCSDTISDFGFPSFFTVVSKFHLFNDFTPLISAILLIMEFHRVAPLG